MVPDDQEHRGHEFMADDLGLGGTWMQTSYNTYGNVHSEGGTPLRYNFAGATGSYDPMADAFYGPQPFPSWVLDENYLWQPPTPPPVIEFPDNEVYNWDESTTSWVME